MAFTSTVHPVHPLFSSSMALVFQHSYSHAPLLLEDLVSFLFLNLCFTWFCSENFYLNICLCGGKKKGINGAEADLLPLVTQRLVSSDEPWDVGADGVIINQKQRSLLWCLYFLCRL